MTPITDTKECLRCAMPESAVALYPKLVVWKNGKWEIASDKEIQGDVTLLDEQYFCRPCLEYIGEF